MCRWRARIGESRYLDLLKVASLVTVGIGGVVVVGVVEGLMHVADDVQEHANHLGLEDCVAEGDSLGVGEDLLGPVDALDRVGEDGVWVHLDEQAVGIDGSVDVMPVVKVTGARFLDVVGPDGSLNESVGPAVSERVEVLDEGLGPRERVGRDELKLVLGDLRSHHVTDLPPAVGHCNE